MLAVLENSMLGLPGRQRCVCVCGGGVGGVGMPYTYTGSLCIHVSNSPGGISSCFKVELDECIVSR